MKLSLRRRDVIAGMALLTGAAALPGGAMGSAKDDPFTLGVASGEPGANSVVIWTRLATRPLEIGGGMPQAPVPIRWILCSDEGLRQVVRSGTVTAKPEFGHAVQVLVEGLDPGRTYWYRFDDGAAASPTGRTKTLRWPTANRLRLVSAGCQSIGAGYYTLWRDIAARDIDVVFHYGDYIYGPKLDGTIDARMGRAIPAAVRRKPKTLDQYRLRYALYHLDPDLQAAHAAHPFICTYDDHEVVGNWAGETSPKLDGEAFLRRRADALQAYYENMPIRPPAPGVEEGSNYRGFTYGNLATLNVLNTRLYRTGLACGTSERAVCVERADPARTILGSLQESWLHGRLQNSATPWNFVCQQVAVMELKLPAKEGGYSYPLDKWDGYTASRDAMLDAVAKANTSGFVVLSGDLHAGAASELRRDFGNLEEPALGTEFLASSISSGGDSQHKTKLGHRLQRNNPSLKFFDGHRGYVLIDCRPDQMDAFYYATDQVTISGSPVSALTTFSVSPKEPKLG